MTIRRSLTPKEREAMYEAQKGLCGCGCGRRIERNNCIGEHIWCVVLGNPEKPDGLWHPDCANRKTNGTKATTYGSDKHAIAKVKRLRKRASGEGAKVKRKIRSRGFQGWRKFNGELVRADG